MRKVATRLLLVASFVSVTVLIAAPQVVLI